MLPLRPGRIKLCVWAAMLAKAFCSLAYEVINVSHTAFLLGRGSLQVTSKFRVDRKYNHLPRKQTAKNYLMGSTYDSHMNISKY